MQFVRGELSNMRTAIMRHDWVLKNVELAGCIKRLSGWVNVASSATGISSLLGIEGWDPGNTLRYLVHRLYFYKFFFKISWWPMA